jgi:broad specificity phosphatase PhoE
MLRKEDTIRIFTSPYRRTRETTEGILRTLTADDDETGPSPFQREDIKVYEEPRLREQDFGNFQPCSFEMERMWQERADYGHFFYRIPNGESAADAYDRVSSFNESLWRQFGGDDFPSVCVLVTHGLLTRVFLMKWYHWTVEYFEDLRNTHHCEFLIMEKDQRQKYELKTKLRTWSELESRKLGPPSPKLPPKRWGGCPDGCTHHTANFTKRYQQTSTLDLGQPQRSSQRSHALIKPLEKDIQALATEDREPLTPLTPGRKRSTMRFGAKNLLHDYELSTVQGPKDGEVLSPETSTSEDEGIEELLTLPASRRKTSLALRGGRDGGGSNSGMPSPDLEAEREEYFEDDGVVHHSDGRSGSFRTETRHGSNLESLPEDPDGTERERSGNEREYATSPKIDGNGTSGSNQTTLAADEDGLEPLEGAADGDIY